MCSDSEGQEGSVPQDCKKLEDLDDYLKNETVETLKNYEAPDKTIKFKDIELDRIRENTGAWLAKASFILLFVIVGLWAIFNIIDIFVLCDRKITSEYKHLIDILIPAITSLVGVTFGFYFSNKRL